MKEFVELMKDREARNRIIRHVLLWSIIGIGGLLAFWVFVFVMFLR
ncbi:hypothetical protein [Thermodesulfovibrio sp. 3462-1]|uniref:Uncharacterized protein n=1 Tax=Thermodesulfovibrio obliviosus TaxID=3118332 RepID=A0AAU8H1V3_9BACT